MELSFRLTYVAILAGCVEMRTRDAIRSPQVGVIDLARGLIPGNPHYTRMNFALPWGSWRSEVMGEHLDALGPYLPPDVRARALRSDYARPDGGHRSHRWRRERSQWSAGSACCGSRQQPRDRRKARSHNRRAGEFLDPIPGARRL